MTDREKKLTRKELVSHYGITEYVLRELIRLGYLEALPIKNARGKKIYLKEEFEKALHSYSGSKKSIAFLGNLIFEDKQVQAIYLNKIDKLKIQNESIKILRAAQREKIHTFEQYLLKFFSSLTKTNGARVFIPSGKAIPLEYKAVIGLLVESYGYDVTVINSEISV